MTPSAHKVLGTGLIFPALLLISVGAVLLTATPDPAAHWISWFIEIIGIVYLIAALVVWTRGRNSHAHSTVKAR